MIGWNLEVINLIHITFHASLFIIVSMQATYMHANTPLAGTLIHAYISIFFWPQPVYSLFSTIYMFYSKSINCIDYRVI